MQIKQIGNSCRHIVCIRQSAWRNLGKHGGTRKLHPKKSVPQLDSEPGTFFAVRQQPTSLHGWAKRAVFVFSSSLGSRGRNPKQIISFASCPTAACFAKSLWSRPTDVYRPHLNKVSPSCCWCNDSPATACWATLCFSSEHASAVCTRFSCLMMNHYKHFRSTS